MESWCNLTWTRKSSLKVPFTLTQAFLYINWTIVSNLFNILSFLKAYPMTTLNTWLKTFSKSANAVVQIRLFSKYFFYNCLNIKLAFLAPHPDIKPSCISSVSTCCFIDCRQKIVNTRIPILYENIELNIDLWYILPQVGSSFYSIFINFLWIGLMFTFFKYLAK